VRSTHHGTRRLTDRRHRRVRRPRQHRGPHPRPSSTRPLDPDEHLEIGLDDNGEVLAILAEYDTSYVGVDREDGSSVAQIPPTGAPLRFWRLGQDVVVGESMETDVWHTDLSWQSVPAVATCLHAQVLPPVGGDTVFASMTAAYELLSPTMREVVKDLVAEHTWAKSIVDYVRSGPDPEARYREQRARFPPVRHRVVQVHPISGRPLLYVNDLFTSAVLGCHARRGRCCSSTSARWPRARISRCAIAGSPTRW
jgi:hypothetical protein